MLDQVKSDNFGEYYKYVFILELLAMRSTSFILGRVSCILVESIFYVMLCIVCARYVNDKRYILLRRKLSLKDVAMACHTVLTYCTIMQRK